MTSTRQDALFVTGLLAIGALTAIAGILYRFGHGLTMDEPFMANVVHGPWRGLWRVFPIDNLPFAYVALKAWTIVFGESETALRSLSALAYGGTAIFTGLATRRIAGPMSGLVAATLIAASDRVGLEYAATARPYALLSCLTASALWQSLRLLAASPDSWRRSIWSIAALSFTHLLGLFTHPSYVVMVTACLAAALLWKGVRTVDAFAPALAIALYFLCWGTIVAATIGLRTTIWMRPPTLGDIQRAYLMLWGVGPGFMLAGALLTAMLSARARVREFLEPVSSRWILTVAVCSWTLVVAISLWKPIFEASRTPMLLLPVTCVVASSILRRCAGPGAAIAVAAICVLAAAGRVAAQSHADPYPTRASLSALLGRVECGDVVIAPGVAATTAEYYFRQLKAPSCVQLVAFPAAFEWYFADWTGHLRDPERLQALATEASAVERTVAAKRETVWLLILTNWETSEATSTMASVLSARMSCGAREPLKGAFIEGVVRCTPVERSENVAAK
jgi:uncharacterized membrane protein